LRSGAAALLWKVAGGGQGPILLSASGPAPMKILSLAVASALLLPAAASAAPDPILRMGAPESPIASLTLVPAGYDLAFVSGATPGAQGQPKPVGTEAQTMDVLTKIDALLKAQNMTMGDVVVMRVFLGVDPDKGGHADRAGMNAAFKKFFGTPEQPNKPARTTVAVTDMAVGSFVEIDAIGARPHPAPLMMKKKHKKG
jgi:enamine deaminase RidA (YjgF/YER057c/UK114 family)